MGLRQWEFSQEVESLNYKMGLTGCGNFLKYSMFLFNAVILIAGCGLLGFGVYIRTGDSRVSQVSSILSGDLYYTLSHLLIASGGVVILLSFLGCCGAIKEVRCMLGTFFILILLLLLGLMVTGVLAYAYRDQIGEHVLRELYRSLNTTYGLTGHKSVTESWDFLQKVFGCCGVEGGVNSSTSWAFYRNTVWFHNQTDAYREFVPDSCCRSQVSDNLSRCMGMAVGSTRFIPVQLPPVYPGMENSQLYTEGCYSAFITFLSDNIRVLGGVAGGIALMMIMAMVFSICLCRRIQDDYFFD
ncbi:CD151 antigen-like isoform X2 [Babylonia areolata]|uniref:CD151 antigen-like isoform X2 n=1 Tax=Babylonia areolata TaxID=304850 RepID=UPI003FD2B5EA